MGEMVQHPWQCNCKGCPNGHGSTFYAAPPEWWQEKGLNYPKKCPACRAWIKEQVDQTIRCTECQGKIRLPGRYKIAFHIKVGVYVPPKLCSTCIWRKKRGLPLAAKLRDIKEIEESQERQRDRRDALKNKPGRQAPSAYALVSDISHYTYLIPNPPPPHTRQEHIERHAPWSPHSQVGQGKSATTLGIGKEDFGALLRDAAQLAAETDEKRVMEFPQGSRVAKIDTVTGDKIIIGPVDGEGYELITAFNADEDL